MKTPFIRLLALSGLLLTVSAPKADIRELFVLAGQSNMLGSAGDAGEYPADPQNLDFEIPFYWRISRMDQVQGAGQWTFLRPQSGLFPAGHFGPEVSFARDLRAIGFRPAIFKFAIGGSSLAEDWKAPGENGLYDSMVAELKDAIGQLSRRGDPVKIRALIWIQGESDGKSGAMAAAYGSRLQSLIADFRLRVANNPKLPVILGVDEQHPWVLLHPEIVTAQRRLAAQDNYTLATSLKGLVKADSTHLTPCALQAQGEILFAAFIKLGGIPHTGGKTELRRDTGPPCR